MSSGLSQGRRGLASTCNEQHIQIQYSNTEKGIIRVEHVRENVGQYMKSSSPILGAVYRHSLPRIFLSLSPLPAPRALSRTRFLARALSPLSPDVLSPRQRFVRVFSAARAPRPNYRGRATAAAAAEPFPLGDIADGDGEDVVVVAAEDEEEKVRGGRTHVAHLLIEQGLRLLRLAPHLLPRGPGGKRRGIEPPTRRDHDITRLHRLDTGGEPRQKRLECPVTITAPPAIHGEDFTERHGLR